MVDEADRLAARDLWPGFDPRTIPVAIYDGERTLLFRHPAPPAGFSPVFGRDGAWEHRGRYPSVTANSSAEIGGVLTATLVPATDTVSVWAARRDGKYVLLTNDLTTEATELAKGYKDLQVAERLFGKLQGVVGLRPNHHQLQERIAAHVLLCVCAAFMVRFGELRTDRSHLDTYRTLMPLGAVTLESQGRRLVHRTKLDPAMREIFEKAGVQPPEKLLQAS